MLATVEIINPEGSAALYQGSPRPADRAPQRAGHHPSGRPAGANA
jgi:hypothetical protein